jgi:cytochrome oxidase Cu insertion factor (SCO1/SenC/PrrC family)
MKLVTLSLCMLVAAMATLGCEKKQTANNIDRNLPGASATPVVGKLAPEIEGPDIDGVNFKLSDYRGQVVLLDFWGNW